MRAIDIHATCLQLGFAGKAFGASGKTGVLILGESGAGKSELALRLLKDGAKLVADDRVDLFAKRGRLYAKPPKKLAGLIEVRGLGIVAWDHAAETRVDLAVQLVPARAIARLPEPKIYQPLEAQSLGVRAWPPRVELANDAAAPAKIAMAAAAYSRYLFRDEAYGKTSKRTR